MSKEHKPTWVERLLHGNVDMTTGASRTRQTTVPGGFLGTRSKTHQTTPKQHNSINNLKHTVFRGGGRIDHSYQSGQDIVVTGHNSHGDMVEVRIEPDGHQVSTIH